MATTILNLGRDVQGFNARAPRPSNDKFSATLSTGSAQSITVPGNFQNWLVRIVVQYNANVWVSFSGTAAVPAGSSFAASTSEMIPNDSESWWSIPAYQTDGVTPSVISFVTDTATAEVSVSFYADPLPH